MRTLKSERLLFPNFLSKYIKEEWKSVTWFYFSVMPISAPMSPEFLNKLYFVYSGRALYRLTGECTLEMLAI